MLKEHRRCGTHLWNTSVERRDKVQAAGLELAEPYMYRLIQIN
jgi:hypothetical protein